MTFAPGGHLFTANVRFVHIVRLQIVHDDEVGRVALTQKPDVESVVLDRMHARRPQHVEPVIPRRNGPPHELIDVPLHERVRVLVVAAKHQPLRCFIHQRNQRVEVFRGRPFANQDLHPGGELFPRFLDRKALVIGFDTRTRICVHAIAAQTRRVSVHRLASIFRGLNFRHEPRVAVNHARIVHHLTEIRHVVSRKQPVHRLGVEFGPCRFEGRRRNARRSAKCERKRHRLPVRDHVLHPGPPEYVGDLVGIADRCHRSVHHRRPGKLRRRQHRTLDMNVRVDESRQQKRRRHVIHRLIDRLDFTNPPIFDVNGRRANPALVEIDELSGNGEGVRHSSRDGENARCGSVETFRETIGETPGCSDKAQGSRGE